ncbi:hypothetical protein EIP91_010951 [Steccherinum ochraceum]|uniref:Uncharacterized protein n=1 Tax=Steccherinum ochraceum TaxID=92696 RepID=A0A4R0R021_9APHY|nr:hypothetical protein EIP91_010951 [Steccherinum ochraceum]
MRFTSAFAATLVTVTFTATFAAPVFHSEQSVYARCDESSRTLQVLDPIETLNELKKRTGGESAGAAGSADSKRIAAAERKRISRAKAKAAMATNTDEISDEEKKAKAQEAKATAEARFARNREMEHAHDRARRQKNKDALAVKPEEIEDPEEQKKAKAAKEAAQQRKDQLAKARRKWHVKDRDARAAANAGSDDQHSTAPGAAAPLHYDPDAGTIDPALLRLSRKREWKSGSGWKLERRNVLV